ncbi:MAG: discoidin domain-containing protein, partial [Thermoanaerobaculia bacterium]
MRIFVLLFLAAAVSAQIAAQTRTLDDFADVSAWSAVPSDNVKLAISRDRGALRLDFDFQGGAGYAVAHRSLALDLPENWEISFRLRADAPVNNLEFKLIDPTGENVWWMNRRNFEFPKEWRTVRIKKRQLEFAWGPIGGGEMKTVAALEIAVTAGTGGRGTVWLDGLTFTALPPAHAYNRTPVRTTGPDGTAFDFLEPREYGGLVIDWEPGPVDYVVEISDDGRSWTTLREVRSNGGRDYLYLPETESRHLRLQRHAKAKPAPSSKTEPPNVETPRGASPRSEPPSHNVTDPEANANPAPGFSGSSTAKPSA